jgi:hypothetical protein
MNTLQDSITPISVLFSVQQDENGFPSVTCEQIWCLPAAGGNFVIDNVPFYARDVSMGDEIATEIRNGERWFASVSKPSRNTTVRVFARKDEFSTTLAPSLESFGGLVEKMQGPPLIAVSFPPSADIARALEYLDRESAAGNVAFEESSVRYRRGSSQP